jgi:antitoxin PrlF
MLTDENETTVDENWTVTIPAIVRNGIDLEPGDRLRWSVEADERLIADVVRERHGADDRIDPVDVGETDAVESTEADEVS